MTRTASEIVPLFANGPAGTRPAARRLEPTAPLACAIASLLACGSPAPDAAADTSGATSSDANTSTGTSSDTTSFGPAGDDPLPETESTAPPTTAATTTTSESSTGDTAMPPLMIGIMVHIETQEAWMNPAFLGPYLDRIRNDFLPLLTAHGARFTWQFRSEILARIVETDDPILDELIAANQGIGVHADKGFPTATQPIFTADLVQLHDQFAAVVPGIRDVSGICSELDWVTAAADAGFQFVTGTVSYCAMSLPLEDRPPEYADCTAPNLCHDVFPAEIERRLHPWRMRDGATWLDEDPEGPLVILPGSGGLVCAEEETLDAAPGNCMHTDADTPIVIADIELALDNRDPDRINAYHLGWSYGAPLDLDVADAWLVQLDAHVATGDLAWATFDEMHDAYLAWEAGG